MRFLLPRAQLDWQPDDAINLMKVSSKGEGEDGPTAAQLYRNWAICLNSRLATCDTRISNLDNNRPGKSKIFIAEACERFGQLRSVYNYNVDKGPTSLTAAARAAR